MSALLARSRATASGRALAVLLDYPDDGLLTCRSRVAAAAPAGLEDFLAWWTTASLPELRRRYAADFELSSRAAPYLTLHRHRDRRDRGRSLAALRRLYREAGWELDHWEQPDYLPLVVEFAAVEPVAGRELLAAYTAELQSIHSALAEQASPWADVVGAVAAELRLDGVLLARAARAAGRSGRPLRAGTAAPARS